MQRKNGFTVIELIIVMVIIALLIAVVLPLLGRGRGCSSSLKDSAQIGEIHASMTIWATAKDGVMPLPGLINRGPEAVTGANVLGVGPEDKTKNVSRHLYSAMIAQNYFNTDMVIGPTEVNPQIQQYETYDYSAYDPEADIYWDGDYPTGAKPAVETGFLADIGSGGTSHASYFHQALVGGRKTRTWRTNADSTTPLLSTRAPYRGAGEKTDDYRRSQTLLLHGSKKIWVGNIVFGDNHTEVSETFFPCGATHLDQAGDRRAEDNIFAPEFSGGLSGGDAFLTMTRSVGGPSVLTDYRETLMP